MTCCMQRGTGWGRVTKGVVVVGHNEISIQFWAFGLRQKTSSASDAWDWAGALKIYRWMDRMHVAKWGTVALFSASAWREASCA